MDGPVRNAAGESRRATGLRVRIRGREREEASGRTKGKSTMAGCEQGPFAQGRVRAPLSCAQAIRRYLDLAVRYGQATPGLRRAIRVLGPAYAETVFQQMSRPDMFYRSPRPGELGLVEECLPEEEMMRFRLAGFAHFLAVLTGPCSCGAASVACFAPVIRRRGGGIYLGSLRTACASPKCIEAAREAAAEQASWVGHDPEEPEDVQAQVWVEDLRAGGPAARQE